MSVSIENLSLYTDLQMKRDTLFDYLMALQEQKRVVSEHYVNIEIGKADWELKRVHAMMSELNNNNPIKFPSESDIKAMQKSVAGLQKAIAQSAAWTQLIEAGDAVLAAWPVT